VTDGASASTGMSKNVTTRLFITTQCRHWTETEVVYNTNCMHYALTRDNTKNSAIADKPRDAFRGQSRRSPNMVPFHILDMVSY